MLFFLLFFLLPTSLFPLLNSHNSIVQEPYIIILNTKESLLWPNIKEEEKVCYQSTYKSQTSVLALVIAQFGSVGSEDHITLLNLFTTVKSSSLIPSPNELHLLLEEWQFYCFHVMLNKVCPVHKNVVST